MGNRKRAGSRADRKNRTEEIKDRAARTGRSAINGVPVILLQLADNLSPFRGAPVFGIVKEVYSARLEGKAAEFTGHNAGDRKEIRRRLEERSNSAPSSSEIDVAIRNALPVTFLTGDLELQRDAVTGLLYGVEVAQVQKVSAREAGQCDEADYWFGVQSLLHALAHVLEVWIDIKERLPRRAWIHKIDAEDYLRISRLAMAQSGFREGETAISTIDFVIGLIRSMDGSVFPPLEFGSSGFTYTSAHCSVCGEDLAGCTHVEGRIYCGKYCTKVRVEDLVFDHVARVQHPHDRRSIYLTAIVDGTSRDAMTGRVVDGDPDSLLVTVHGRLTLLPDIAT